MVSLYLVRGILSIDIVHKLCTWYIDEFYGFKVKKEDFEKNAKVLYLNTNIAENIVNKSNKVVFVKLNKQEILEKTYGDVRRDKKNIY